MYRKIPVSTKPVFFSNATTAHLGSSGGSLVATPDCKLQFWVQIQQSPQPTVDCQSLDGLPSRMALCCMLPLRDGSGEFLYKKTPRTIKEKKFLKCLSRDKSYFNHYNGFPLNMLSLSCCTFSTPPTFFTPSSNINS
jgi:hypothetical protein